jgi:branched-chain amino acid transport system permease protein
MSFALISALNGVIFGLLLFMVSAGLTLIFGMMGVLNFAHASFYMVGAYIAYSVSTEYGFLAGILAATIAVGLLGMFIERFMLRRVHRFGHAHELLLTFGLAIVAEEAVKIIYGNFPIGYKVPEALRFTAFELMGSQYPFYRLLIGLVAITMFAILVLVLNKTRIGVIVKAAEKLPVMAQALGHNVPIIFTSVFGVGAALAGLAGGIAGAFYPTSPQMATELGVVVFVVVVIGGLGSLAGSFIASMMIGLFVSFSAGLDWSIAGALGAVGFDVSSIDETSLMQLKLSSVSGAIPFLLMLLVLVFRPTGLLGDRR